MDARMAPLTLLLLLLCWQQHRGSAQPPQASLCASDLAVGSDVELAVDCVGPDSKLSPKVFYAFTEAEEASSSIINDRVVQIEYVCASDSTLVNATQSTSSLPVTDVLIASTPYPITATSTVTLSLEQSYTIGVRCTFSGCYKTVSIDLDRGSKTIETYALKPTPCTLDFDECLAGTHNCSANAECINTEGSCQCHCRNGFEGNGTVCQNINECETQEHNCSQNANCNDTDGSFTCVCKDGYQGDGILCTDINECSMNATKCSDNEMCINTNGTFLCSCVDGYQRDSNTLSCIDIDECQMGLHNCSEGVTCENSNGSFSCVCREGFEGTQCIMGGQAATLQLIGIAAIFPTFLLLSVCVYICYTRKGRRFRLLSPHKHDWLTTSPMKQQVDLGFSPVDAEPSHNLLASVHSVFDTFQPRDATNLTMSCVGDIGCECATSEGELCDYCKTDKSGMMGADCELDGESISESETSILHGSGVVNIDVSIATANERKEKEKEEEKEEEEEVEEDERGGESEEDHSHHNTACQRTSQSLSPYLGTSHKSSAMTSFKRPTVSRPIIKTVGVASSSSDTSGIESVTSDYVYSDNSRLPSWPHPVKQSEATHYYSKYDNSSSSSCFSPQKPSTWRESTGNQHRIAHPHTRELHRQDSGMGFDVEEEIVMDSNLEAVSPPFPLTSINDNTPLCLPNVSIGPAIPLQTTSAVSSSRVSDSDGYVMSGSEFSEGYIMSGSETPGLVSDGYVTESLFSVPHIPRIPVTQESHSEQ